MARIRSPNYPQISLPAAIERLRSIYKAERQNRIDRDVAVRLMGFSGYNGASAGVLSALLKYGLLEPMAEKEMRVSDLAVRILIPHDDQEKAAALSEAAARPPLFKELAERWPDDPPSEHSLRTYLTRRGFADSALEGAIRAYTETLGLVDAVRVPTTLDEGEGDGGLTPADSSTSREVPQHSLPSPPSRGAPPPATPTPPSAGPGMALARTPHGYVVHLSGSVLVKEHVDEVVALLTALKASLPDSVGEQ
jgi:hypothetical protein